MARPTCRSSSSELRSASITRAQATPSAKVGAPSGTVPERTASRTTSAHARIGTRCGSSRGASKANTSCVPSSLRSVIFPSATDSSVPSEPRITTRGGEFFTATNVVSMVTDAPVLGREERGEPVLRGAGVHRAVGVGALGDVGAQPRARVDEVAERPAQEVDDVRTPRADPAAASFAVEQPAVGPHRDAEAGAEHRPLDVLDGPDRAVLEQRAQGDASRMMAELEVEERDRVGRVARRLPSPRRRRWTCRTACRRARPCPASSAAVTHCGWRNGGACTATRSTSGCSHSARTASASRGEMTSTSVQPSVSANTGATTVCPNPRPMTPTPTVPSRPMGGT